MKAIKNKLLTMPRDFWIYNYAASLVYFIIDNEWSIISLLLFPLALIIVEYLIKNFSNEQEFVKYFGFFPFITNDIVHLIIALVLNYIVWQVSFWLVLISIIFFYTQNNK